MINRQLSGKRSSRDVSSRRRKMQQKGLPWSYIIPVLIIVAVIVGLIAYNTLLTPPPSDLTPLNIPTNTPPSLSNVPFYCDGQPGCTTIYHWHVHLDIFVGNNSYVYVPSDLGHIGNTNLFAIHAHDSSGIVHLECCTSSNGQSVNQTFTLGEVFAVWGYPTFDSTHCLTYNNEPVTVYVNGVNWTKTPIADIPLSNHAEIAIVVGSGSHPTIPSSYSFPSGL